MKQFLLCCIWFPMVLWSQTTVKKPRVLFIGNSYTYVNNLPQLLHDVAAAAHDTLIFDSNCPGGYTFFNHSVDATTIAKISLGNWDYVVLQAQSQEPSFSPAQVAAQTLPYAIGLDTLIKNHNPCATTVFYETWGRKFGDASNCASYPPVCTYTGMQNRLKQSYLQFADTCHALFSPAGEAFRKSISLNPNLELYQSDQSHPSIEGSYLTACVFYELLYQKSVLTNSFNPGIGAATLNFLQQTAHAVVNDSLAVWNVGKYYPKANFTASLQGASAQFDATYPYLNHTWYFGDGTMNMGPQVQHSYVLPGFKQVSHVVDDGCKRDSVSSQIEILNLSTTVPEFSIKHGVTILPNPANSFVRFQLPNGAVLQKSSVKFINLLGQVFDVPEEDGKYSIENLPEGLYVCHANGFTQTLCISR